MHDHPNLNDNNIVKQAWTRPVLTELGDYVSDVAVTPGPNSEGFGTSDS